LAKVTQTAWCQAKETEAGQKAFDHCDLRSQ